MTPDDKFDTTFIQLEQELRSHHATGGEDRYLQDVIWVVNSSHDVIYINKAVEPVLGLSQEEVLGQPVMGFVYHTDKEEIESLLNSVLEIAASGDKQALGTMVLPLVSVNLANHAGEAVPTQTTMNIRQNSEGGYEGLFGIVRDVSEQRALEGELRRNEELLRKIFETTPEAISVMDAQTDTYLDVNEGFGNLTGWSRDEVIGKTPADLKLWANQDDREELARQVSETRRVDNFEARFRQKNGTEVSGLMSITTFLMDDRTYIVSSVRNIEALRKAERDKSEMEKHLLQAQKIESLGTLAGGIAHNFNNILMAIQGNASLLELEIDDTQRRNEYLRNIDDLIGNAAELTTELLAFGRPNSSTLKPLAPVDLIREQVRLFSRAYPAISMASTFADEVPTVLADAGQLSQVLMNLFINARDAMSGQGSIAVHASSVNLAESETNQNEVESGEYVHLSVRDSGAGMDETTQKRIFDPFFTTKGAGKGTGLGLASVHNIVRNHDGFMTVVSAPGEGATFNVYLPVSGEEPSSLVSKIGDVSIGSETILIVDDDPNILSITASMLHRMGYKVLQAESGQAAVNIIEEGTSVDLVLLDMIMPVMDGAETCNRLKTIRPGLKIILSSGFSETEEEQIAHNFDDTLQKPYKIAELSTMLRSILDRQ